MLPRFCASEASPTHDLSAQGQTALRAKFRRSRARSPLNMPGLRPHRRILRALRQSSRRAPGSSARARERPRSPVFNPPAASSQWTGRLYGTSSARAFRAKPPQVAPPSSLPFPLLRPRLIRRRGGWLGEEMEGAAASAMLRGGSGGALPGGDGGAWRGHEL